MVVAIRSDLAQGPTTCKAVYTKIVGYNIRPPEGCMYQCSFYLTLHHTSMSAPFYTSERICSPHPKWKEIDSEITQRMSSTNVVIRIWCHILHPPKDYDDTCDRPQDTIIQTWGVYFTGLRYLGANLALNFTSDCFKSNTLVFQMHGGYFCSYKSLKLDIMPPENEMEHSSLSSDSSGKTNLSKTTLESRFLQNHRIVKESRSISPSKFTRKTDKEYSKSHSPVERGFQQNFPTLKNSASLNIAQYRDCRTNKRKVNNESKLDPNHIYEHSPDNLDVKECTSDVNCDSLSKNASREELSASKIDLSETAENYDLRNESDGVPKYRYYALNFLKSEIRPSYNSDKLQKLHILQYSIKKKQEAVQEIKKRIYKNSALTSMTQSDEFGDVIRFKSKSQRNLFSPDDAEELKENSSSQSDSSAQNGRIKEGKPPVSNGPRLTLKLNDLLSFKAKPSPFQRAEHVRLTKQIEILRFKRLLLADERDSKLANIRKLKETHNKLSEENQDLGLELMQKYHNLSRLTERMKEQRQTCGALRELAAQSHRELTNHSAELLSQLAQIFYIEQKDQSTWKICDVPLPICADENPRTMNPVSDSVAAGFVAQATVLAAAILNLPLRYKITLLGSASKILDITPDLPDPNIPLFARGGDAMLFRYAMFLLNKSIAQLMWARGLPISDMRPTLANLQRLLTTPPNESVDGQSPQAVMSLSRHRHSRSVGSYNDDQELPSLDQSTTSIMGSEPNIYNTKLAHVNSAEGPHSSMKSHNSDSEILRLATERRPDENETEKVIFTLGDDTCLPKEILVKLSSNNEDQYTKVDEVKRICSEIKDFCTDKDEEGFDVVKHMEAINVNIDIAKYMEEKRTSVVDCENCASDVCDVPCANNVTDVIVIPSAEAILDTGQSGQSENTVDVVEPMQ
ncbi:hypothetical protein MSG28_015734 [Choristoneura fumiferana]|uniref:Uncharacterized protein n=1 Tax=Choristoneura fumiferana TaxID=7141 RepID=A0ACC0KCH3_CHOFU|nr:hypothetical protein MSG28_015734 [Choristoneura fumiferana]